MREKVTMKRKQTNKFVILRRSIVSTCGWWGVCCTISISNWMIAIKLLSMILRGKLDDNLNWDIDKVHFWMAIRGNFQKKNLLSSIEIKLKLIATNFLFVVAYSSLFANYSHVGHADLNIISR